MENEYAGRNIEIMDSVYNALSGMRVHISFTRASIPAGVQDYLAG